MWMATYILGLQQLVLYIYKAECLFFMGSGLFHEHTLSMYRKLHKGVDCYKIIKAC